jgi:7-keto-8-aminopelargonate synthetase-like enzyme
MLHFSDSFSGLLPPANCGALTAAFTIAAQTGSLVATLSQTSRKERQHGGQRLSTHEIRPKKVSVGDARGIPAAQALVLRQAGRQLSRMQPGQSSCPER